MVFELVLRNPPYRCPVTSQHIQSCPTHLLKTVLTLLGGEVKVPFQGDAKFGCLLVKLLLSLFSYSNLIDSKLFNWMNEGGGDTIKHSISLIFNCVEKTGKFFEGSGDDNLIIRSLRSNAFEGKVGQGVGKVPLCSGENFMTSHIEGDTTLVRVIMKRKTRQRLVRFTEIQCNLLFAASTSSFTCLINPLIC